MYAYVILFRKEYYHAICRRREITKNVCQALRYIFFIDRYLSYSARCFPLSVFSGISLFYSVFSELYICQWILSICINIVEVPLARQAETVSAVVFGLKSLPRNSMCRSVNSQTLFYKFIDTINLKSVFKNKSFLYLFILILILYLTWSKTCSCVVIYNNIHTYNICIYYFKWFHWATFYRFAIQG